MTDVLTGFNTRRTHQMERADARQERNNAGGYTFTITPMGQAKRFLILGTQQGTFYQTPQALTRDNAQVVVDLAAKEDTGLALVDLIADVSARGLAAKVQPTLFAFAIVASSPVLTVRRYALSRFNEIIRTGTHLFTFLGYIEQFRGWGPALRKAVSNWYLQREDGNAFQVVKYRSRNGFTHRDVLRLAHPKAITPAQQATFAYATTGMVSVEEYASLSKHITGFELAKDAKVSDLPGIIREYDLSWEMLPTEALNDAKVWETLLDKGLPHGALVRQLPRLTNLGLLPVLGGRTSEVAQALVNPEALRKARLHPINLLIAQITYAAGQGASQTWTPNPKIVDALDAAFYASFETAPTSGKRHLIGVDVSGSMGSVAYPINGNPYSYESRGLTSAQIAGAFALAVVKNEPESHVFGFAHEFREIGITPNMRMTEVMQRVQDRNFGRTDCSLPMQYALQNKLEVDTFVVITDNETYHGRIHPHQALREYREKTGIAARLVVMATTPTRFSIADPSDSGMLDIAGFSADVPSLVTNFSKGF